MLETVFEPVLFRFETDQHARRFAVARDDDLLRLCLSKKPRQIVLDFGQWNFLHSGFANCASHDSASDLATIAKTSTVVPETCRRNERGVNPRTGRFDVGRYLRHRTGSTTPRPQPPGSPIASTAPETPAGGRAARPAS